MNNQIEPMRYSYLARIKNGTIRLAHRLALCAILVGGAKSYAAGTDTWVGNTDANWNTAANWTTSGGSTPPASGDSLVFGAAGSSGSSLNNNISGLTINKLTFNSGASSFNFGGNGFTISTGGIDASALTSGTMTITNVTTIGTGLQRWNVGAGATLAFGSLGAGADAADLYTPNGAMAILSKTGTIKTTTADGWGWRSGAVAGTGLLGPGVVIDNGNNTYDWASVGTQTAGTSHAIVAATYTTAVNSDAHNVKVTGNTTVTPNASWASLLVQGATLTHNGANLYLDTGIILENAGVIAGSGPIQANSDGLYIHVPDSGAISSKIQNNGATAKLLYKAGPGTLTLSGANTYTGNTVVYEGALIQSTAATGAGGYVVKDGATLGVSVVSGGTLKMSALTLGNCTNNFSSVRTTAAIITNTGALTLAGTVTVNVSGSVTTAQYPLINSASITGTGGFVVGTVPVGWVGSIATNGNTIVLNVSVDNSFPTCGGVATPNPVNLRDNVLLTVTVTNGGSPTISSVVVNASAIGGSSSLNLVSAGNHIYTNSVKVTSVAGFGVPVQLPVTVTDGNNHSNSANISLTVNPPISSADTWVGNTDANWGTSVNWTFSYGSGPVSSGDSLVFGAAGSSGTSLNNNISSLSVNNLTFNSGASAFTFGGNAFTLTGNLTNNAANNETLNGIAIGAGVVTTIKNLGSGTLALGSLSESGGGTVRFSINSPISTSTTDGGMLGSWAVIDNGNNTYDWAHSGSSGVNNIIAATYDAPVAADAGNVMCTTSTNLINNAHTWGSILVSGANLNFGAWNLYLASGGLILQNGGIYTGAGSLMCNGGVFFVHVPDAGTINAKLQNNGSTAATLFKDGPGTLTLSGANTYTGSTVIYEGALIQSTAATGAGSYVVKDGAKLGVSVVSGGTLNMSALSFGNSTNTFTGIVTSSAAINNTGALTLVGTVTVNVGGLILPVGQYPLIASASIGGAGGFAIGSLPPGVVANIVTNGNTIVLNVTASQLPTFVWTGLSGNSWDFSTANNWSTNGVSVIYTDGQLVRFDDSSAQGNVNIIANVTPLSLVVSNSTRSYTFSGSAITGSTGLTKSGNGTLVLANANTYTGNTTISSGTLQLGDGFANIGAVAGNITDYGCLTFANPTNQTFSGVISGSGMLVVASGTNTLTLTGANNFTGSTTVSNGSLVVSQTAGQTLGTNITVMDGATLSVMEWGDATYLSPATLTVGSSSGATLQFGVVGTNNPILTPGTVTLHGTTTIQITRAPYVKNVNIPLFTGYTGGTLVLGSQPLGWHGQLVVNGSTVSYVVTNFDFVHPGCMSTLADIARMQAKIAAGAEPWTSAFAVLANNGLSSASYNANPQPYINRGGANQNYTSIMFDAAAAYESALRYRLTGDTNFAEASIRNMNGYSSTLVQLGGSTDALLMLGAQGFDFACAAELMRDYQPWVNSGGFDRFKTMLLVKFYENPANGAGLRGFLNSHNGTCWSHYWLNWDGFALSATAAIGVVCDRKDIYDFAVNYFKSTGSGNGMVTNALYFMHPGYLGQSQEMGRDMGHASIDPVLLAELCEVAWNQGDDLFGYDNNAVLAISEFTCRAMTTNGIPWVNYAGCDVNTTTCSSGSAFRAGCDMIWNHYVNIKGLSAPYTMAESLGNRPEGGGGNYGGNSGGFDQIGFTTLTHALDPISNSPAPSLLRADAPLGGTARVWWYGSAYATSYNIKRATSVGGPYAVLATNLSTTDFLYTDTNLTPDMTYYYVVSAIVNGVETTNSLPVSVTANRRLTGTVIGAGSIIINGQGIYQLFDNAPITWFDCSAPSGGWAGLDLGDSYRITKVGYCPRNTYAWRMTGGRFQGCNVADFSSGVVTLCTIGSTPPEGTNTVQTVTNTGGYRYVRYIGPPNGYCNVADLQFEGVPAPAAAPVPPALQAYLKFNESSGTTAADATGNGWNGTLVNSPAHVAGYSNNAVNLNGSSQYATLPSGVVANLDNFSISAWVKLTSSSAWSRIFDFGTGQTVYMFLAPQNGVTSVIRFAITTGGSAGEQVIDGTAALPTGVWKHVAVTIGGNTGVLYVDGVPVGTNSSMSLLPSSLGNTTQNYIGKSQFNDPYFNGQVDEFRIYNDVLSAADVATFVTPLVAPANVNASAGDSQIALSWDAAANASSYSILRSLTSGGPYTLITNMPAIPVPANTFTDTALTNGVMYYYVVRAANDVGVSPNSLQVSARPVSSVPPNVSCSINAGKLQLNWFADHTGWRLQMNTDLAGTNWLDVPGANGTNALSIPTTNGNVFYRLVYP